MNLLASLQSENSQSMCGNLQVNTGAVASLKEERTLLGAGGYLVEGGGGDWATLHFF